MRRARPIHALVCCAVVLSSGILALGCGSDEDGERDSAPTKTTATRSTTATTTPTTPSVAEPAAAPTTANAGAAVATGRKLDLLARAYAPVSARLNFLVTAEVLWRDAVDNDATAEDRRTRAGAVRLEIVRMRPILVRAQRAVQTQVQAQPEVRAIQTLLITAIRNRALAMQRLDALLDASSDDDVDDDEVEALDDSYRAAHDASARAAREATDAVQELRASLGLDPAPEEALR